MAISLKNGRKCSRLNLSTGSMTVLGRRGASRELTGSNSSALRKKRISPSFWSITRSDQFLWNSPQAPAPGTLYRQFLPPLPLPCPSTVQGPKEDKAETCFV